MARFIVRNHSFVLQSETDVVKPFQQALAKERIDEELCAEALPIADFTFFQINRDLIAANLLGAAQQFTYFRFG